MSCASHRRIRHRPSRAVPHTASIMQHSIVRVAGLASRVSTDVRLHQLSLLIFVTHRYRRRMYVGGGWAVFDVVVSA